MADLELLDRAFAATMTHIIETGEGPHYIDVAAALDISPNEGRQVLHDVMAAGVPGWMHPGTDYLASFPPFNIQPTQYRVTVEGRSHRWYAQCGFEALAFRWIFPGEHIRVEAPCLDCGDAMVVEMEGEELTVVDPPTLVGYTSTGVGGDAANRPFR